MNVKTTQWHQMDRDLQLISAILPCVPPFVEAGACVDLINLAIFEPNGYFTPIPPFDILFVNGHLSSY